MFYPNVNRAIDDEFNPYVYDGTIKPNTEVTSAESAVEALSISLRVKAVVDLAYMQQLTGIEPEKLLADLQGVVYANPMHPDTDGNPRLETADEFLSGKSGKI